MDNPTEGSFGREKSESEIVQEILAGVKITKAKEGSTHFKETYEFIYGGKKLTLFHYKNLDSDFSSSVEYIPDQSRLKRETTLLYLAAKEMMENIAKKEQKSLKFQFSEDDEDMKERALEEGEKIFEWGGSKKITKPGGDYPNDPNYPEVYTFTAIINPKK